MGKPLDLTATVAVVSPRYERKPIRRVSELRCGFSTRKENGMSERMTVDDRTPEQKATHVWGVVARDKFMSGWGQASKGDSRCAWACAPEVDIDRVERWVRNRREMRHVNIVNLSTYRPPRGTVHFHIYVCEQGHPATR